MQAITAKTIEKKNRIYLNKLPYQGFFIVIHAKHGFYNGGKVKNFEIPFLANTGLEYTKRRRIATFGGACFLRKVDFVYIFMRKSGF